MGERKVVQKYIPPDFDPSLVPRGKKLSSKDGTTPVRMMLPFSIQCSTCKSFLYRGRKFNSKKEFMGGPDGTYLGIKRWRFYIKCSYCSRPISFLTDPQNADYEMESGGTRNYEITKDRQERERQAAQEEEQATKEDPLKALEARVLDSQREMADLDNLEEIKAMNARHVQLLAAAAAAGGGDAAAATAFGADTQAVLQALEKQQQQQQDVNEDGLTAEDEALVKSIQFGKKQAASGNNSNNIRRLGEEDELRLEEQRKREAALVAERQRELANKANNHHKNTNNNNNTSTKPSFAPVIKIKRKLAPAKNEGPPKKTKEEVSKQGGLATLLGGYGSDSESE